MKLLDCSHADISVLRNALLINPNGSEFRVIAVTISLRDLTPWLHIKDLNDANSNDADSSDAAIPFDSSLKDWSVQLGNYVHS